MKTEIERKCLSCKHCAEDPADARQMTLIGQRRYICVSRPPCACTFPTPQGIVALTSYPVISAESISCGDWTSDQRPQLPKA